MDSELAATLARIEERQIAYERVAHELVSAIGTQTEILTAILEATTADPGPSPTAAALQDIAKAMQETNTLLTNLPDMLATVIREEMAEGFVELGDDDFEPAGEAFEREEVEREEIERAS